VPWLALALAVLALSPGVTEAQATAEPGTPGAPSPAPAETPPPDAAPPPRAASAPSPDDPRFDADFDDARDAPSIALGPAGKGDVILSVDVGWLRSGARADLGITNWLDIVLRADALLLYERLRGPKGVHVGLRVVPVSSGTFRAAVEGTIGQTFVRGEIITENILTVSGQALAGAVFPWAHFYARVGVRGMSDNDTGAGWTRDAEFGLGAERAFRRLIFGAEAFVWSRPTLSGIGQWRLRLGYAF
jgi:hypothetical protein